MSQVDALREAPAHALAEGVTMRPLFGRAAMLNLVEFAPGAHVPVHSHPHEQLGYVLDGTLVLQIAGVEHRLPAGHAYAIPGGVEHAARSDERCVVLDVFHPVREDYRERVAAARD